MTRIFAVIDYASLRRTLFPCLPRNPLNNEEIAGQARNDESVQIRVIRVICVQKKMNFLSLFVFY